MSLINYSPSQISFILNGRKITNWGQGDVCLKFENIMDKSKLVQCQGGGAFRSDVINQGKRISLNLQPGSPDASYAQGLLNSNANINYSYLIFSTTETVTGYDGVIANNGDTDRGTGESNTNKVFQIDSNRNIET